MARFIIIRNFIIVGHDVIAQAQSGTGKTATFTISLLQQLDISLRSCQALVLAPTRELAQQVGSSDITNYILWMGAGVAQWGTDALSHCLKKKYCNVCKCFFFHFAHPTSQKLIVK